MIKSAFFKKTIKLDPHLTYIWTDPQYKGLCTVYLYYIYSPQTGDRGRERAVNGVITSGDRETSVKAATCGFRDDSTAGSGVIPQ